MPPELAAVGTLRHVSLATCNHVCVLGSVFNVRMATCASGGLLHAQGYVRLMSQLLLLAVNHLQVAHSFTAADDAAWQLSGSSGPNQQVHSRGLKQASAGVKVGH